ncbi:glycosyltransferase family 4 protein [Haliangium ochraceum]|uniref:Glycosyl transferase group 1 n=1 Tax=Haliangium ochraceum (strain DSM 14365 / JCM 11303 / SMP-2) TaxID=502025 RepID=D0LJG1_HALO1|nr:glycosyltransferase family 4 protein [Haliangium ochraceum]ACY16535.1 glycosyl transferase group 1 [Haliangium ochraceum DSM 14365]
MSRILMTGFFCLPAPDRVAVQMHHLLRALSRHHEVDVLVARADDHAYVERSGGASILRVPTREDSIDGRLASFRRALRRQLGSADYDLVHFRDGWCGSVVVELRQRYGYITVFDAARAPLAGPPILDLEVSAALARDEELCLQQADHVLVPTALARAHLLEQRGAGVHLVPPGVDVDLFDWLPARPGPPLVLYAGAVEAGRGLRVLLRAFARLAPHSDARLVIAGRPSGNAASSLNAAIAELGIEERVTLEPAVANEDMPELIARAAVCVAPSAAEVSVQPMALYPTKILEYMACRRAVVAARRGAASLLIEDGVHGVLFRPGDAEDLADKLLLVLEDAALRERLAAAGYRRVRDEHTASNTRRAVRAAYAGMQVDTSEYRTLTLSSVDIIAPELPGSLPEGSVRVVELAGGNRATTDEESVLPRAFGPVANLDTLTDGRGPQAASDAGPTRERPSLQTRDTYRMPAFEVAELEPEGEGEGEDEDEIRADTDPVDEDRDRDRDGDEVGAHADVVGAVAAAIASPTPPPPPPPPRARAAARSRDARSERDSLSAAGELEVRPVRVPLSPDERPTTPSMPAIQIPDDDLGDEPA